MGQGVEGEGEILRGTNFQLQKQTLRERDHITRGEGGEVELDEGSQKVQISSYKINMS